MFEIMASEYIDSLNGSITKNTEQNYKIDLKTFEEFLNKEQVQFELVNDKFAEKYKIYLMNIKKYSNSTTIRKLQVVEWFYNYLVDQNYIVTNPFIKIKPPKINERLPQPLNLKEVDQLLKAVINQSRESGQSERNKLIVELATYQALRVDEIVNIKLKNVDLEQRTLLIDGKGSKERLLIMTKQVIKSIKDYMRVRDNSSTIYLMTSARGQLSKRMAQKIVKDGFKEIGLGNHSIHDLRHTSATLMLENGIDIRGVQSILGHANIRTTTIYASVTRKNKENIANKMGAVF